MPELVGFGRRAGVLFDGFRRSAVCRIRLYVPSAAAKCSSELGTGELLTGFFPTFGKMVLPV
jgi:hypothetical protein